MNLLGVSENGELLFSGNFRYADMFFGELLNIFKRKTAPGFFGLSVLAVRHILNKINKSSGGAGKVRIGKIAERSARKYQG